MTNSTVKTLYVQKRLLNPDEFIDWAKQVGFKNLLKPEDLHVTLAYSTKKIDWSKISPDKSTVKINGGVRKIEAFGEDKKSIVLLFESNHLKKRWQYFLDNGCSWDYPSFKPHVSITYEGTDLKINTIAPYDGQLRFGPEEFDEVKK